MIHPRFLKINDFDYHLPDERIARYPASERDGSKLLLFQNGQSSVHSFKEVSQLLPANTLLISNDTRVIPARIYFQKSTGAVIELFCLEPVERSWQDAMTDLSHSTWKCLVGGAKKWKGAERLRVFHHDQSGLSLQAEKVAQENDHFIIRFFWEENVHLGEMLERCGELPLPPYFNRQTEASDYDRYQTIFATYKGSVAAPTAGLHFTPAIMEQLAQKGILAERITLHVGAGTFKPVSSEQMEGHEMHSEQFSVKKSLIKILMKHDGPIVAVGTTTTRALESLYWLGVRCIATGEQAHSINQWDPYDQPSSVSTTDALSALLNYMESHNLEEWQAHTSIMIAPGYSFKIISGLFTNFHMPKSTLLLLVSAVTGKNKDQWMWQSIYDFALRNDFRFLSYGDSSLLWCADQSL